MQLGFGVTVLSRCLASGGVDGIGSYTRELFSRLTAAEGIEVLPLSFGVPIAESVSATRVGKVFGRFATSAVISGATGMSFPAASELCGKVDLVHATDHLIPKLGKIPVVATIYDAIPLSHPEWVVQKFRYAKSLLWRHSSRWAAHVITISEYSKQEIQTHFGIPESRITSIPLGVDSRWFRPIDLQTMQAVAKRLNLPEHYFLFVGTLQPRKNVGRIISAYKSLPLAVRSEVPLVVVGRAGWQCEDVVTELNSSGSGGTIRWLQHLPDSDLLAVMKRSTALVFPSLCEGFGLPVLEAFASETPVITSNGTSLPEVAGDAALLVNPLDESSIAAAMMQILDSPELRAELRAKGMARARIFSWDQTAARTVDVYRQML